MLEPQQTLPSFTPVICYPKHARAGETYLLTIDVRLDEPDLGWTLPEEEYQIFFQLKTQPCFNYQPLGEHEPSVILHRFGGTYGPAEYMLTTAETEIKGKISVTLINRRGIPIGYTELECSVSSKNERVVEADTAMSHPASIPTLEKVPATDKNTRVIENVDVCIICALAEEATAFQKVLEKQGAVFQMKRSQQQKRNYLSTTIPNRKGDTLSLILTWQVRVGLQDAAFTIEKVLQEFEPRFLAMTGFCGGNKSRVKIGDLIVADKTFIYDSGGFTENKDGKKEQQYDIITFQMPNDLLQNLRMFTDWTSAAEELKQERPISKHQQKDWLLNQLLQRQTTIDKLSDEELTQYAPNWREILDQILREEPTLINEDTLALRDPEAFRLKTRRSRDPFPYQDAENPTCHIGSLASGNAVRNDNPFPELENVDRKILGLDMEGTTIYHALQEHPSIRFLVAKGVSDYADGNKDYHYHGYAASLSAAYVSTVISYFVNDEYMPRPDKSINTSTPPTVSQPATVPSQTQKPSSTTLPAETVKPPVKIFFSCSEAEEDQKLIAKFSTHLSILKRIKPPLIENWDRHHIEAGNSGSDEIRNKLAEAQIILLMMSPDYYSSDSYDEEIQLIEQCRSNGAKVIPILLRKTDDSWKDAEFYGGLLSLPRNNKPVTSWPDRDVPLSEIAKEIRGAAENIQNS